MYSLTLSASQSIWKKWFVCYSVRSNRSIMHQLQRPMTIFHHRHRYRRVHRLVCHILSHSKWVSNGISCRFWRCVLVSTQNIRFGQCSKCADVRFGIGRWPSGFQRSRLSQATRTILSHCDVLQTVSVCSIDHDRPGILNSTSFVIPKVVKRFLVSSIRPKRFAPGAWSFVNCIVSTRCTRCRNTWRIGHSLWNTVAIARTICLNCKTWAHFWNEKLDSNCDRSLATCRLAIFSLVWHFVCSIALSTFVIRRILSTRQSRTVATSYSATCRCWPIRVLLNSHKRLGWLRWAHLTTTSINWPR